MTSKADYYQKMVQSGAMTPTEVREQEGRMPVKGGDEVFISCNVAPITSGKISGEPQASNSLPSKNEE